MSSGKPWGMKVLRSMPVWPSFKEELARSSEREIVFQVNGKIRDKIVCRDGTSDEELKQLALASAKW